MHRFALVTAALVAAALFAGTATSARSTPAAAYANANRTVIATATCGHDYYKNVSGRCVHRPSSNPRGATARCSDGTYSYSQHASGTCSHHGGVAVWIHHP
jgi:hypothetical protein